MNIVVENVHLGDSLLTLTYATNIITSTDTDNSEEIE